MTEDLPLKCPACGLHQMAGLNDCWKCGKTLREPEIAAPAEAKGGSLKQPGYASLLAAAKRLIEDERFDYYANSNCPDGQEDDGVRIWNDLVAAIHAADPEYEAQRPQNENWN